MFCPKCGAQNPDDGAFCQKCGASLKGGAKGGEIRATDVESGPKASFADVMKSLSIETWLTYGAITALIVGFLVGILTATESFKAAGFFDGLWKGILAAGILLGFSGIIFALKKK